MHGAHDVAHGHAEQPEGIVVPQVLLGGKRQPLQVVEALDVFRGHTCLLEFLAVVADRVVDAFDNLFEPLELQRFQRLTGQRLEFLVEDHATTLLFLVSFTAFSTERPV
jgi:hypothetical protein